MRNWFFVILVGLVSVTPAALAATPRLDLTYNTVSIEGELAFSGALGVLEVAPQDSRKRPFHFQLEAEEVSVIEAEDKVAASSGVFTAYPYRQPTSRYFDATWNSTNRVPDAYLVVMSRPDREPATVRMAEECVGVSTLAPHEWSPVAFVTQRSGLVPKADLDTPLQFNECGSTWALEITGDFFLVDWEMKGRLNGESESGRVQEHLFESGFHPDLEAPQDAAGTGSYVQDFATVENGRILVTFQEPKDIWLTANNAVVEGADLRVRGHVLEGTAIDASVHVPAGDFVAAGHNQIALRWQNSAELVTQVTGEAIRPEGAREVTLPAVDEQVLQPGTTAAEPFSAPKWVSTSVVALLVAAGIALLWFLKPWHTNNDLTDLARQAIQEGKHRQGWRLARAAVVRGERSGKAEHVVAEAAHALRNYQGAMFWYTKANKHLGTLEGRAENAYRAAACAAKTGEPVEASTWLTTANGLDLGMMLRAEQDPVFDALFATEGVHRQAVPDYLRP